MKRNFSLTLIAALLLIALLVPAFLSGAAPQPTVATAEEAPAPALGAGKTFIDWLVVKHITVQAGGMDMSSNLDMQTYIVSNIGNAGTDFDTSGGLTAAGESTFNGGIDLNANTIKLDALGTTTVAAATKAVVLMTSSVATGTWAVRTGNLTVGNGTPSVHAVNGEDAYVEGDVEVDGTLTGVAIKGTTGTFTTSLTAPDITASDDLFVTDDADINDNLAVNDIVVTSTSDLRGDVADSLGIFTIADSVDISNIARFAAGAIFNSTVKVTGTVTLGGLLDLNSNLGMTGNASVGGTLAVTSTSDLRGDISDSAGILTLNDKTDIKDIARFTGAAIFNSTIAATGTVTLGGLLDLNSNLGMTGNASVGGTLAVTSTSDLRGDISDSAGVLTLNDKTDVKDILRVTGAAIFNSTINVTTSVTAPDLIASDDVTVADDLTVEGMAGLGSHAQFTPTYTMNTPATWSLVPTASYYNIGSGGAVTMTLAITDVVDGQLLVIYGEDNNTVTINDINLLSVGGSTLSLTQYDIGVFIFIGGGVNKWAQISLAGNS